MHYRLTHSEQLESSLVQLPVELRLMILKTLLVHVDPLCARKQENETPAPKLPAKPYQPQWFLEKIKEETASPYDLHPAILATCQTLSDEGRALLYGCNTIGLQFNNHGVILYANTEKSAECNPQIDYLEKLVTKFDSIHIDICCTCEAELELKDTVLGISDLLYRKNICIEFINPDNDIYDVGGQYNGGQDQMQRQLALFRSVRCMSLQVLNKTLDPSFVSAIVGVTTSDGPVVNLWPSLEDFRAYHVALSKFSNYDLTIREVYYYDETHAWYEMETAAWECDAKKFREVRTKWMEELENEYKQLSQIAFRNDALHNTA